MSVPVSITSAPSESASARKRVGVRGDDAVFGAAGTGRNQFVTGREDRDARFARAFKRGVIHRRREPNGTRGDPFAFAQQHCALSKIITLAPDIFAGGMGFGERDVVAVALGLFLFDDDVGAFRHDRAGENADRLTALHFAVERMTRGGLAGEFQSRVRRKIGRARRVTIHCRYIEWRLGAQRFHIGCEHAADGFVEGDFFRWQRRHAIEHSQQGIFD